MPVFESEVLKPREPSLAEDDWAEFVLSDASVGHESNGKPANLLLAYADTPLKVQGRLEAPSREHSHYVLQKPFKPTEILVRGVTRYAYEQQTDGAYKIWALGEAGWFEIQPAAHYKAIYHDMIEAVDLLFFVTDIYNEPRKKGGGPSASLLYREYAEDERSTCTGVAEAERIFRKHREFLIMCFLNRTNDIGWSNTPLYQTFRRNFPKDFERCKARNEGRFQDIIPERISRTSRTSPAPVSQVTAVSGKSQTSRGKTSTARATDAPKKDDNWWEAATLFEFMQKAVNQRVIRAGRNSITVDRVAQLIIKRYEIEDVQTARNILLVHAQNLCYMMDHPRRQNIRFFAAEPIYGELTAGHSLSAAEQRRAEGAELRPRKDRGTLRGEDSESSDTSDEEDDEDGMSTPKRRRPGRSKKGALSVLRPRSGKFSGKGKSIQRGGKGKTKPPIPVSDSGSEQDSDEEDAMAIDTPTQALSPGPSKRKLAASDQTTDGKRKRTRSTSIPPSSPPTSGDETPEPGTADPPLPLRYRAGSNQPTSKSTQPMLPAIVCTPLPTYESNGPRDSWICSFDGCAQRIYGCSKEIGRQLITEHLEDHTKGREKVVGILWREQDKLHLPVNNLIKKIREMSEAKTPLFPASPALPQPIQRPV
ncbi:defective in methylation-7 protein [Stagonosporopsis vannaccii]|nr:defective in methylation-7 protein [Stagonosporopsis vannaccii]